MHTPMTSSIRGACSKASPPLTQDNEAGLSLCCVDCLQGGGSARVLDSKAMEQRKHVVLYVHVLLPTHMIESFAFLTLIDCFIGLGLATGRALLVVQQFPEHSMGA